MAFADVLIVDRHLEAKSVGIEVVARYRRDFTPRLLPAWKRWLADNHSANWATTDAICGALIGPLLLQHPALAERMRAWARDRNMWVRRASIVGLIRAARRGESLDLVVRHRRGACTRTTEDLIQKAVGWTLREAGKTDMARLERYLRANGPAIPRTTLRYAIERFPEAKRRALLAATQRPRTDRETIVAQPSGLPGGRTAGLKGLRYERPHQGAGRWELKRRAPRGSRADGERARRASKPRCCTSAAAI